VNNAKGVYMLLYSIALRTLLLWLVSLDRHLAIKRPTCHGQSPCSKWSSLFPQACYSLFQQFV